MSNTIKILEPASSEVQHIADVLGISSRDVIINALSVMRAYAEAKRKDPSANILLATGTNLSVLIPNSSS